MKKLLILVIIFCLFLTSQSLAASKYVRSVGGNWTDNATWSTTSGGSADTTAPTTSDTAYLDANSGNVTVNATSAVAQHLDCTGYTGTLTFTASQRLAVSGNVKFVSGMTLSGTGDLRLAAAGTFDSGGLTFPGNVSLFASATITLQADLTITGTLFVTGGTNTTLAGEYNVRCGTLTYTGANYYIIMTAGQTLTVDTAINMSGSGFGTIVLKSATGSSDINLVYNGTAANAKIAGATFTDVDASGSAVTLYNWYGSGVDDVTKKIKIVTAASIGSTGGSSCAQ